MDELVNYKTEYTTKNPDWPIGVSSGAVVYRNSQDKLEILLVVRSDNGNPVSYNLPKGTLYLNETLESCAHREVREEAGVEIKLKTYLGGSLNEYFYKDIKCSKIFHYFAAEFLSDLGEIDHEHDARVWLDIETAKQKCRDTEPEKNESAMIERLELFLKKYGR